MQTVANDPPSISIERRGMGAQRKLKKIQLTKGQAMRVGAAYTDELICLVSLDASGKIAAVTVPSGSTLIVDLKVK